jgi:hypothetical protein
MKIKAVKKQKVPNYPRIDLFIHNPEMLNNRIPVTWYKNKIIAGALSTFVLCGSCTKQAITKPVTEAEQGVEGNRIKTQETKDLIKIAPIFVHGDGSGAIGCIVMSPPVFIDEDEAMKIILGELSKAGLSFDTADVKNEIKFKSIQIAVSCSDEKEIDAMPLVDVEIKFDGYNKEKNIVLEYVAVPDFEKFAIDPGGCSVSEFNTKKAAEILRSEIVKNGNVNAVVFYDPMPSIDRDKYEESGMKKIEKDAKDMLVAQVSDFIAWAKTEGLIK